MFLRIEKHIPNVKEELMINMNQVLSIKFNCDERESNYSLEFLFSDGHIEILNYIDSKRCLEDYMMIYRKFGI